MSFDKKNIEILISLMSQLGITHVVISPGSRNAPAIILFQKSGLFRIIPIADERSAGFFALGMAQYLQRTVALLSTSGTAVLNYSPAIAEAYYQKIPLLIITADRPEELIDQGDGQTIHQRQVFDNFIRKSFHLSPIHTELEERHRVRIINEAIALTLYPVPGPIHINLPLTEPLYDLPSIENVHHYPIIQVVEGKTTFDDAIIQNWLSFNRKLLIVGQLHPDHPTLPFLELMSKDPTTQIIAETTSNLFSPHVIINADLLLANLSEVEKYSIAPDLILTFGGNIISKNVKSFVRNLPLSIPHWRIGIDPQEFYQDTFYHLSHTFFSKPEDFLENILRRGLPSKGNYQEQWQKFRIRTNQKLNKLIHQAKFTDLYVYSQIFRYMPDDMVVHLANSTPVRYAQFFDHPKGRMFFSNRGTSGIDGCLSTAVGFAYAAQRPVTIIVGDMAFFYDQNALWNKFVSSQLNIILINNCGGNIFRIIEGPDQFEELEEFIEMKHHFDAREICKARQVRYLMADNKDSLEEALQDMFSQHRDGPLLLEIFTPAEENAMDFRKLYQ